MLNGIVLVYVCISAVMFLFLGCIWSSKLNFNLFIKASMFLMVFYAAYMIIRLT